MKHRTLRATPALALTATMLLASCATTQDVTLDPEASDNESATADVADDGEQESTSTAAGRTSIPDLVPVPWPEAPRELTDQELLLMHEPGPYAGDAYNEDAVLAAVQEMDPETPEEWIAAILSQIHGDYADDVKTTVEFDPTIGDDPSRPDEQEPDAEDVEVGTNHFALVLDASGSMAEESDQGTRMEEATGALTEFVDLLPPGSTVSLRVYGQEGTAAAEDKAESCESTEVTYTGAAGSEEFGAAVDAAEPSGWTPLATAISAAQDDIPAEATDSIVYVVTDGLETCGGDPVSAAKDLAGSGVEPIINVIGYQTGDADQEQLQSIADAGGGTYTSVESVGDLDAYWDEEYRRMMTAWNDWREEALAQINTEGGENRERASEVGRRLMDTSDLEGEHGMQLVDRLEKEGMEYDLHRAVWSHFYDRGRESWAYGYDTSRANWAKSYDQQRERWSEAYDTSRDKWSEYYTKSRG